MVITETHTRIIIVYFLLISLDIRPTGKIFCHVISMIALSVFKSVNFRISINQVWKGQTPIFLRSILFIKMLVIVLILTHARRIRREARA